MSDLYQRVRYLPAAMETTTRKLRRLVNEARGLGLDELANEAWNRVIIEAQADTRAHGGSIGFGDGTDG